MRACMFCDPYQNFYIYSTANEIEICNCSFVSIILFHFSIMFCWQNEKNLLEQIFDGKAVAVVDIGVPLDIVAVVVASLACCGDTELEPESKSVWTLKESTWELFAQYLR